jgi:hypothetical protein
MATQITAGLFGANPEGDCGTRVRSSGKSYSGPGWGPTLIAMTLLRTFRVLLASKLLAQTYRVTSASSHWTSGATAHPQSLSQRVYRNCAHFWSGRT